MANQIIALLGTGVIDRTTPLATGDDLGITRGDGCFDATLVVRDADGASLRVLDLPEHLDRLDRSAAGLEITGAPTHEQWTALVDEAIAAWDGRQAALKLVLTRGDEHDSRGVTAFCSLTEMDDAALAQRDGIRVCTLSRGYPSDAFADAPWLLGGVKTLSYAVNVAVKREAERRDADDTLFVSSDGYVLEGPTSSLVWLDGDTLVTTPVEGTGILRSITQTKVFADAGYATAYRLATPEQVRAGGGAWLLSSVRGVAPVTHLDGVELARDEAAHDAVLRASGFAGL